MPDTLPNGYTPYTRDELRKHVHGLSKEILLITDEFPEIGEKTLRTVGCFLFYKAEFNTERAEMIRSALFDYYERGEFNYRE